MEVNPEIFYQVDPGGKKPSAPAALGGQAVMSRPTVIKLEGAAGARARAPTPDSSVKVMVCLFPWYIYFFLPRSVFFRKTLLTPPPPKKKENIFLPI